MQKEPKRNDFNINFRWNRNRGKGVCGWLQISCQNQRSKHLNFNYIYRICYKNAKKQNLRKRFALFEKTISHL